MKNDECEIIDYIGIIDIVRNDDLIIIKSTNANLNVAEIKKILGVEDKCLNIKKYLVFDAEDLLLKKSLTMYIVNANARLKF